ncbi:hypothetical protein, partial [Clavibacter michiganensis]|uniref:hypothetical protein n=1 Tax=Clavibacter michiganensis TaxID=28447 RepID=UPI00292D830E
MTLAVRSGVLPFRSNRTRPVAASRTWPSNVARRGSCALVRADVRPELALAHARREEAEAVLAGPDRGA